MMPAVLQGLDPGTYLPHALHASTRAWPETNCYVDLWIELLAAQGFEPAAALGFTLAQDFEGDQFTFFKVPSADLERLFGLEVLELAIFDSLEAHVSEQIGRGRMPIVEVDAFFLPDTRGVSYRGNHSKTTIAVNGLDRAGKRIDYFHNAGFFTLSGEDYDGIMGDAFTGGLPLAPYVEFVKIGRRPMAAEVCAGARALLARHFARRPVENPLQGWKASFPGHVALLRERGEAWFHLYAFNTLRQVGANFELLASHLGWLALNGEGGLEIARRAAEHLAQSAKVMQFKLARAVARGTFEQLPPMIDDLAARYDEIIAALLARERGGVGSSRAAA
jgi:hypothetical protein